MTRTTSVSSLGRGYSISKTSSYRGRTIRLTSKANCAWEMTSAVAAWTVQNRRGCKMSDIVTIDAQRANFAAERALVRALEVLERAVCVGHKVGGDLRRVVSHVCADEEGWLLQEASSRTW